MAGRSPEIDGVEEAKGIVVVEEFGMRVGAGGLDAVQRAIPVSGRFFCVI